MAPVSRAAKAAAKAAPATVTLTRALLPAAKGTVLIGGSSARFTEIAVKETAVEPTLKLQSATAGRQIFLDSQITPIAVRPVAPPAPTPLDVVNASPLVGQSFVRTTTLAKRLEEPKSREARDYSTSSRFEAITSLIRLVDSLTDEDGGFVPGLFDGVDVHGLEDDGFLDDLPVVNGKKAVSQAVRGLHPQPRPAAQADAGADAAAAGAGDRRPRRSRDVLRHHRSVRPRRRADAQDGRAHQALPRCDHRLPGGARRPAVRVRERADQAHEHRRRSGRSTARRQCCARLACRGDAADRRREYAPHSRARRGCEVPRFHPAARDREPADHADPRCRPRVDRSAGAGLPARASRRAR